MSIRAKVSKNFKHIIFSYDNIENPSEEDITTWTRLIDVFNDNLFKTFLDANLKTIEVPWNDIFEFFNIINDENIEIIYEEFILNKINQNQTYKGFISSLPKSIKPSNDELEALNQKLKELKFNRDLTIFQLRDLYKMISIDNSANFSVPGAGKTSVELARILINDLDRVIVFVPNELVSDEWQAEVEECFPENTYKQVVLNGNLENLEHLKEQIFKINSKANIHIGIYEPTNLKEFDLNDNYFAFSGIGNHNTFISMIRKFNLKIQKDLEFPDHYQYSKEEINKIIKEASSKNYKIITTEKDYERIKNENYKEIKFIKTELKILDEEKFIQSII